MKLIDSIKAVATGQRRKHITQPLHRVELFSDKAPEWQSKCAREYTITVTLGASEWIAEEAIEGSGGKVIDYAIDRMKDAIVHKVYGELAYELKDLRDDIYYNDRFSESEYYNSLVERLNKIIEKITL
jgi:hypothetical protein